MAESQAKIRLTMDGQQAVQEADRLKNKTKDAATAAGALGKNWEQGAGLIAKQLVGVMALVAAIRQGVNAVSEMRKEQGEAYKTEESAAKALAVAEKRAGLPSGFARTAQTRDFERTPFTTEQAVEVIDMAREAKVKDPKDIERALFAYGSGLFAKDELFDKRRRRAVSEEEVSKRYAAETPEQRKRRQELERSRRADIGFAEQGAEEAAVTTRAAEIRRRSDLDAFIGGVQPEILNRSDARRELRREAVFERIFANEGRSRDESVLQKLLSNGIKTRNDTPQPGAQDAVR